MSHIMTSSVRRIGHRVCRFGGISALALAFALVGARALAAPDAGGDVEGAILAKLEDAIAADYRNRIRQRLSMNDFSIRAKIEPKTATRALPCPALPAIPRVGALSRLEPRLAAFAAKSACEIELAVELGPRFDETYRKSFSDWLAASVKKELGPGAFAMLASARLARPKLFDTLAKTGREWARGLDTNVVWIPPIFATLVTLAYALFKRSRVRAKLLSLADEKESVSAPYAEPPVQSPAMAKEFRSRQTSIALTVISIDAYFIEIARLWLDSKTEGRRKLAAVIDAMLVWNRGLTFIESAQATDPSNWEVPALIAGEKAFLAACRGFGARMPIDEKHRLLGEAQSDLQRFLESRPEIEVRRFDALMEPKIAGIRAVKPINWIAKS